MLILHVTRLEPAKGANPRKPAYKAEVEGYPAITCRVAPISEAARHLIALGADPETPINQRSEGSAALSWAVAHPLSYWAAMTAEEGETTSAVIRRYRPVPIPAK